MYLFIRKERGDSDNLFLFDEIGTGKPFYLVREEKRERDGQCPVRTVRESTGHFVQCPEVSNTRLRFQSLNPALACIPVLLGV